MASQQVYMQDFWLNVRIGVVRLMYLALPSCLY